MSFINSVYVEYGYLSDVVYASNTQYMFPLLTTVYGFSSYSKFGSAFLALSITFLFINILLSSVTEFDNANFKSLLFIANISLSINPTCIPEFPS